MPRKKNEVVPMEDVVYQFPRKKKTFLDSEPVPMEGVEYQYKKPTRLSTNKRKKETAFRPGRPRGAGVAYGSDWNEINKRLNRYH